MDAIKIGGLTLEFLHSKDDTVGSLDLFRMTVQPKAKMPAPHYHESRDEAVYGLAGTLVLRIDGTDHAIGPGGSVFIARGVVHSFRNHGDEPAVVLSVLTPGVLGPAYFRELAELMAAGGPPHPATVKEIMTRYGLVPAAA
ncbi:cupin domain-containing protein [Neorhizobium sp. IRAMC:178]|uniref:cupin domain-containing protein n=1 Tax=Neorhizobium tunisiense TaxID=3144793 RepID=UPI0031F642D7